MWEFEHSVETKASRAFAWRFWTDVSNWAFDSSIEWVRLEGPFASGTMGETKSPGLDPVRWELKGVRAGEEAVVEMPLPGATLRFHWRFEDTAERGTRITQRASLDGPAADDLVNQGVREFERGIPDGMRKLADLISESARSSSQSPD